MTFDIGRSFQITRHEIRKKTVTHILCLFSLRFRNKKQKCNPDFMLFSFSCLRCLPDPFRSMSLFNNTLWKSDVTSREHLARTSLKSLSQPRSVHALMYCDAIPVLWLWRMRVYTRPEFSKVYYISSIN